MATYRDKQKRSHFESFANKIYTGIREIKPEYAEKRAVWELFQNALDTIEIDGEIEISKTEKGFIFSHNGRPFSDLEFGGLIKQFSVGKTYGDNKDAIGQYGTGFISTHVYGKMIEVNASIRLDNQRYKILERFVLDRDAKTPKLLTDKLLEQDEFFEKLIDDSPESVEKPLPFTSFEYFASENNHTSIANMLEYVKSLVPYIFCFNGKLKSVKINNDKEIKLFERKETTRNSILLSVNNEPLHIPFIQNEEPDIKIILGSGTIDLTDVPKVFLFYPLMDTSEVGHNFLIHANDFKPNKERDYLHLITLNDEIKSDVETNEKLLTTAFNLVTQKIKSDNQQDFWEACKIEFTDLDSDLEKELKESFVNEIKVLERIDIKGKFLPLISFEYFDSSILEKDADIIKAIYTLISQFKQLPSFDLYCEISTYVNNWNTYVSGKFTTLTMEKVGEILSEKSDKDYMNIQNKEAYKKYVKEISTDVALLKKLALTPNIHGDFITIDKLVKWDKIETELIDIVDHIDCSISEKICMKIFILLRMF